MNVIERLIYIAEDGCEFDTAEACKRYEKIAELAQHAKSMQAIYWRDTSPTEVFGWLVDHYDVKRKSEGP